MFVHPEGELKRAEQCNTMRSLSPSSRQAVHKMVAGGLEFVGVQRSRRGSSKKGPERIYYKSVFRGIDVMECFCRGSWSKRLERDLDGGR